MDIKRIVRTSVVVGVGFGLSGCLHIVEPEPAPAPAAAAVVVPTAPVVAEPDTSAFDAMAARRADRRDRDDDGGKKKWGG